MDAATRAVILMASFYLFRAAYRRVRGLEGLGLDDVKLAAVAGAWVDWRLLPHVIEAAALFGLALVFARARKTAAISNDIKLPFAVGFAQAIFFGGLLGPLGF